MTELYLIQRSALFHHTFWKNFQRYWCVKQAVFTKCTVANIWKCDKIQK